MVKEYTIMTSLSTFAIVFEQTMISGLDFYSLTNCMRARIMNGTDIREFMGKDIFAYIDENIYKTITTSASSYIVEHSIVIIIRHQSIQWRNC